MNIHTLPFVLNENKFTKVYQCTKCKTIGDAVNFGNQYSPCCFCGHAVKEAGVAKYIIKPTGKYKKYIFGLISIAEKKVFGNLINDIIN